MRVRVCRTAGGVLHYEGDPTGLRCVSRTVTCTPDEFVVHQGVPSVRALYYRASGDGIDIADTPAGLAYGPASLSDAQLMGLVYGVPLPPDVTLWPGVRRLTPGDRVRVGRDGVGTQRLPVSVPDQRRQLLPDLIADTVPANSVVAWSGGLASTSVALAAVRAGLRPRLVHVAVRGTPPVPPLPVVAGIEPSAVTVDVAELLDERRITGHEPQPPLPDVQFRHGILRAVADHGGGGGPVVTAALLQEAFQAPFAEAKLGLAGRRLFAVEPFHAAGRLANLRQARDAVRAGRDGGPGPAPIEEQTGGAAKCDTSLVTDAGAHADGTFRTASAIVWRDRGRQDPTVPHRLEALIAGRKLAASWATGPATPDLVFSALSPAVLAAAAHTPAAALVAVRRGRVVNSLPLATFVGDLPVHRAGAAARFRIAAAAYLAAEGPRIARDLTAGSALVDRGLLQPERVQQALRDCCRAADVAAPLLRAVWLDRWLRQQQAAR